MIRYLILPDAAAAEARSRAAFTPDPGDGITVRRWEVIPFEDGSGAALAIPDGADPGLSTAEQAALTPDLPPGAVAGEVPPD